MKHAVLPVLAFLAGMITMKLLGDFSSDSHKEDSAASDGCAKIQSRDLSAMPNAQDALSLEAIRAAVRAELSDFKQDLESAKAESRATEKDIEAPGNTDEASATLGPKEESEKFRTAQSIVEETLSDGVWNQEKQAAFRELLTDVDPAERDKMTLGLIQALNSGKIDVQTVGPPF